MMKLASYFKPNEEQCGISSMRSNLQMCTMFLIIAPPYSGKCPSPSDSARTYTALPENPHPDIESSSSSTPETPSFDSRERCSGNTMDSNPQIQGTRQNGFCLSCPISAPCQQVLNFPLNLRQRSC